MSDKPKVVVCVRWDGCEIRDLRVLFTGDVQVVWRDENGGGVGLREINGVVSDDLMNALLAGGVVEPERPFHIEEDREARLGDLLATTGRLFG